MSNRLKASAIVLASVHVETVLTAKAGRVMGFGNTVVVGPKRRVRRLLMRLVPSVLVLLGVIRRVSLGSLGMRGCGLRSVLRGFRLAALTLLTRFGRRSQQNRLATPRHD